MLRNRLLILLGGFFLAASAARADEVGYVDCSNNSDDTQVFSKARKTPEVMASIPCGERFTVLVYGFVFSRIQTKDGNIGYIYSNLIAVDRSATAAQKMPSAQMASAKAKIPSTRPAPAVAAKAQPTPAAAAPAQAPSSASESAEIVVKSSPSASVTPDPAPAQPATAQPASRIIENSTVEMQPARNAGPPPPAPAAAIQPSRPAPAQPEPAPAEPVAPAIKPADTRSGWEKPLPGIRRAPLLQLFGGYSLARMDGGGGAGSNINGAVGSFGWNVKPWLQIVADTSYNVVTTNGTKNVLYGNHFGPRYFHRRQGRWGLTPFAEALVGGSRADTSVAGSSIYDTSVNCISFKVGGGVDIHPSRHFDIRLFDADYYRTSFGTNVHQNNYWVSAGIVIRLFGGGAE
jgi:hypothetical protein